MPTEAIVEDQAVVPQLSKAARARLAARDGAGNPVPAALWAPALIAITFLVLPLVGLVVRAPWGRLTEILSGPDVREALVLSLWTSTASAGIALLVGIPLAFLLARASFRGIGLLRSLVTLPLVLPPVVGGVALLLVFGREGIVGKLIYTWTGFQIPFTPVAVVMAETFVAMPFLVVSVEGALRTADRGLEEAAATLGRSTAGHLQPRHAAAGRALDRGRNGAVLGEGSGGVRRDHHLRWQLPRPHPDDADPRVLRLRERPGRRDRPQPRPAGGVDRGAGGPAGPLGPAWTAAVRAVDTPGAGASAGGLVADLEVRRGSFSLAVSFGCAPGEILGVLGPNGAGKSTLLRCLAGLTPVTNGRITIDGRAVDDGESGEFLPPRDRQVGFVFQDYRLFPHLSVQDNVAFGMKGRARRQARSDAVSWLDRLGLQGLGPRRPAQLSGGQQQRVALARALACEPRLLLLDEPLAALDAASRLAVQAELRQHLVDFAGPCLLVTHDPLEALMLADRLLVIEDGRIVQQGAPADVARQPSTDYIARLVGLNLYSGQGTGDTLILDGGGTVVVAAPSPGFGGRVLAALRPSSIVVTAAEPVGSSIRNSWPGVVTSMTLLAGRVRLDVAGPPRALVDVTPGAVTELDLRPGREVWLSVKATDIEVYPAPGQD